MIQSYDRRAFLARSARMVGGLTVVSGIPFLAGCGDDDDAGGGEAGTVGTQFNWVPDVEWAAWYLGEENGHFAERNVTSQLGHGGPNTPAVVQVLAAGDGNVGPCTSATRSG
jgi:ABC-type nitrate/sulfonate/bicarbonate transport system substrate-binding protein